MNKVSVIMGVYNPPGKAALARAVHSVLEQTYPARELIICDDRSTDDTWSFLQQSFGQHPEIILVRNRENLGLSAALNHCLRYASGSYIARQDADDYSLPERIARQVCFLEAQPGYAFAGTGMLLFDAGGIYGARYGKEKPGKKDFIWGSPFAHATLVIRREALLAVNGYRVARETRRGQDYDLFMRLYAAGFTGCNIQEALYHVCEDAAAFSRRTFRRQLYIARIQAQGFRMMGLPAWSHLAILKTAAVAMIPNPAIRLWKQAACRLQQGYTPHVHRESPGI